MSDRPPYELTRNPVDGSWGFVCLEHATYRSGLVEAHARNVESKHVREQHADPLAAVLNLSEAARSFLHYNDQGSMSVWRALTGLDHPESQVFAQALADAPVDVTAAVVPF